VPPAYARLPSTGTTPLSAAGVRHAAAIASVTVAVARERPNPDLLLEKLREKPYEAATLSLPIETAGKRGPPHRLGPGSSDSRLPSPAPASMDSSPRPVFR